MIPHSIAITPDWMSPRLQRAELFHGVSRQTDADPHPHADHRLGDLRDARLTQRHSEPFWICNIFWRSRRRGLLGLKFSQPDPSVTLAPDRSRTPPRPPLGGAKVLVRYDPCSGFTRRHAQERGFGQ